MTTFKRRYVLGKGKPSVMSLYDDDQIEDGGMRVNAVGIVDEHGKYKPFRWPFKPDDNRPEYQIILERIPKRRGHEKNKQSFWDRVDKCKHTNLSPVYLETVSCPTEYCSGSETHCLDCGAYIQKCGCGYNNGMYGGPLNRQKRRAKR